MEELKACKVMMMFDTDIRFEPCRILTAGMDGRRRRDMMIKEYFIFT